MQHFSTEEWIDFVNQVTSSERTQAMQKHLATGCKRCGEAVSLWQKVRDTASVEASYQPSAETVRLAKAAFAASGLAGTARESSGLVELLFDSFAQPAFAGTRSTGTGIRQMLYRANPYQIDIQIEAKPATNRLLVTGQFLDVIQPSKACSNVQVVLSNRRGNSVVAGTNQNGEFSAEIENSGDLELSVPGQGQKPVVISLRNALGQKPGGKA
jgi:hypothetical protein